jgi:hypothetical protein
VSFARGIDGSGYRSAGLDARTSITHEEERRSVRSSTLGSGTLACARCDAPVALGADPLSPSDWLTCPFCEHHGPARDFLSLARPTRPARVIVRVTRRR